MKKGGLKDKNNLIMYSTLLAVPPIGAVMARRSGLDKKDKDLLCIGAGIMTFALTIATLLGVAPTQINAAAEVPDEMLQEVDESQFLTVKRPQYDNTIVAAVDMNLEKELLTATAY